MAFPGLPFSAFSLSKFLPWNRLLPPGCNAPDFSLLDQTGRQVSRNSLLANRRGLLLIFFTSDWLPVDQHLLRHYAGEYSQFQAEDLALAAVSGINWETLFNLHQRLKLPYPVLFDPCCRVSKAYKTLLIPKFVTGRSLFQLDPSGEIIHSQPC